MYFPPKSHLCHLASLVVAALFVITAMGAAQHETSAEEDRPDYSYDYSPLKWRTFSRDADMNGVDDMIDHDLESGAADEFDVFLTFDHRPGDHEKAILAWLGVEVVYRAEYQDTFLLWDVPADTIYRDLRYLEGVNMVELAPVMKPLLDVSTKAIKVRPGAFTGTCGRNSISRGETSM